MKRVAASYVKQALLPLYRGGSISKEQFKNAAQSVTHAFAAELKQRRDLVDPRQFYPTPEQTDLLRELTAAHVARVAV